MENVFYQVVDMAEWFPGASGMFLQAINLDNQELEAEIKISASDFSELPGYDLDEDELPEYLLEKILDDHNERIGG